MIAATPTPPRTEFSIPTLMYHRVISGVQCKFCVGMDAFERHIQALADHVDCITAQEGFERFASSSKPGNTAVILTFDDGYEDFYIHAFPVLKRYDIRATVFLPTDHIGKTNIWNPKANYVCNHLSWRQIEEMAAWGIEFGSHARRHHSLVKYDATTILDEVAGSADIIERALGIRPRTFAYPYGVYNSLVRNIVAEHYDLAFSVTDGTPDWTVDRYVVNRRFVSNRFEWPNPMPSENSIGLKSLTFLGIC